MRRRPSSPTKTSGRLSFFSSQRVLPLCPALPSSSLDVVTAFLPPAKHAPRRPASHVDLSNRDSSPTLKIAESFAKPESIPSSLTGSALLVIPTSPTKKESVASGYDGLRSDGSVGAPQASLPLGAAAYWAALEQIASLSHKFGSIADGAAAGHSHAARQAAAKKLIANHLAVLYDVTNTNPETQHLLQRLSEHQKTYVEQANVMGADQALLRPFAQVLREVARRLLGRRPGSEGLEAAIDIWDKCQAKAWIDTVQFLQNRIQDTPEAKPGREPDLSEEAAKAMRAVLEEVGSAATSHTIAACSAQWAMLEKMLSGRLGEAEGAAAAHSLAARREAAGKLISNHEEVLRDVINPAPMRNIFGLPLTQLGLQRVESSLAAYVDQALREVARRLLGEQPGSSGLETRLDAANSAQISAWVGTAKYLEGRIQCTPEEKPGRAPDMSPAAGAAMRAVLREMGTVRRRVGWEELRTMAEEESFQQPEADGVATAHSHAARKEAAAKLIDNHVDVLKDVTNPSQTENIVGDTLTQQELTRVDARLSWYVDQALREVARRLLGRMVGSYLLEVQLDPYNAAQASAWARAAAYLSGRVQATADQKPGRKPDMSYHAALAFIAVVREVGGETVSRTLAIVESEWSVLSQAAAAGEGFESRADGLASAHSHKARQEAAAKLISNHADVLRDVTNPSQRETITGATLTQLHLLRVDIGLSMYVDQALREVTRRLLGRRPGLRQLRVRLEPAKYVQVAAWIRCAGYLRDRLQLRPDQMPGRTPDLSPPAGEAMLAVLDEVEKEAYHTTLARSSPHWMMLHRISLDSNETTVEGKAASHAIEAREAAAKQLIQNHKDVLLDVTNPSCMYNIVGSPLSQKELERVDPSLVLHVDEALREVTRRLLGERPHAMELQVRAQLSNLAQAMAWAKTAVYLTARIQSTPEQKPEREPDLDPDASAAICAVLEEVASSHPKNVRTFPDGSGDMKAF
ncbi:MAG: hypothetical protein SGPRY_001685 [Prymnesium sp.]